MRKVCVVTGSRAEYGLLYWLMKEIQSDSELQLQIIVTGMHLSPEFGLTYKFIEADGFTIDARVEMLLSSDTAIGISKSIGLGVIGFADALNNLKPEIIVLLGDRFEILAAAQAAMVARIPIAHIHGGELTEGAYDEGMRHAITKLAQVHFVAADPYRKRVVQLGELPEKVFNFGAPGLDHLNKISWVEKEELESDLGIKFQSLVLLVTYHPVTLAGINPVESMNELLNGLAEFEDATILFTYPNADSGGRVIIELIDSFVSKNKHRRKAFVSLGQRRYLSVMRYADVIIGNSSSGLIETPFFKKPTVNIGDRQKGRLKAKSIIDCIEKKEFIISAIQKAISEEFKKEIENTISLYGIGNTSNRIKEILKSISLEVRKPFFDLDYNY